MRAVLAVAVAAAVLAGCGTPGAREDRTRIADEVAFTVRREGGLCPGPQGGGQVCVTEVVVRDDGTWTATGAPPPEVPSGRVDADAADRLASVFAGGLEELTAAAATGTCPRAYDGQELILTVRRLPRGPGAERADAAVTHVASCEHDLTSPPARATLRRLEAIWRELGLPPVSLRP